MNDSIEKVPEHIPSRTEVLEQIGRLVAKFDVIRELSDASGLYLLEVDTKGENKGEVTMFRYSRKGNYGGNICPLNEIQVVYFENDEPVGGRNVAFYDEASGQWQDVV